MTEVADQPNVPKLRFPEFEGEWVRVPLHRALREKKSRNRDNYFGKSDVLSVSGDAGVINQIDHMGRSYAGVSVVDYHVVGTGDVVYTKSPLKSNPFGIIKTNHGPAGIVSTLYAVYEVREQQDSGFWGRYFELDDRTNHYLMPLVHKGAKNDMKINNARVLIDPVTYPEKAEQEKIATLFDTIDLRKDGLNRRLVSLKTYKKGTMQRLFSRELRFTRDDGSPFLDWQEKRLGSLGRFSGGGTPDTSVSHYWSGEMPWISSSDISEGSIIGIEISRHISKEAIQQSATCVVPAGSLLIVTRVGVGKFVVSEFDLCTSQDFSNFTPIKADPRFLAYWLTVNRNSLLRLCQGTSIQGLTTVDLKKMLVEMPDLEEQQKIADFLSALDTKIDAVASQIDAMERFKKGLLQQMFV